MDEQIVQRAGRMVGVQGSADSSWLAGESGKASGKYVLRPSANKAGAVGAP